MFEIVIHNWGENETVNYRLVLIKGVITENGNIDKKVSGNLKCCVNNVISEWRIYEGGFKCLASLTLGMNKINLSYVKAKKILNIFLKHHDTVLCIVPVYMICDGHDGKFQSPVGCDNSVKSACNRIGLGVQLIQCIFGEKLKENGFSKKSFQIENDLDETAPLCRIFQSKLCLNNARSWDHINLWEYFGRELMFSELGSDNRKYLAFLSCTLWDGYRVIGDPALAGSGLALIGTGCLHTWPTTIDEVVPCFTSNTKVDSLLLDNSCHRGTYGGCYSTTLGSVCHEIGHMFNLGHAERGIMSRGFDYTNLVFTTGQNCPNNNYNKLNENLLPILEMSSGEIEKGSVIVKHIPKSKYSEDDLTHLTHTCAAILAYHRWFNNDKQVSESIKYDRIRSILTSEAGLKVVQIRGVCGAVLKSWEVGTKAVCKHLILPRTFQNRSASIIAIDTNGVIFNLQI